MRNHPAYGFSILSLHRLAKGASFLALAPVIATCGGSSTPAAWTKPVPKAICSAGDRVETGLQGQTTLAERTGHPSASETAYNCNLQLVSQVQEQGAQWQLTWFNDCAYFGTYDTPEKATPGVPVVDASDPVHPKVTTHLTARAMIDPWESLKVNEPRKLLGATKGPGFGASQPTDRQFAFYDISSDCTHPALLSDYDQAGHTGHAGDFAPDGKTYYGTGAGGTGWTAMDISDPSKPKFLFHGPGSGQGGPAGDPNETHDISISQDGNRAYLTHWGNFAPFGLNGPNGLLILDTSDIQKRAASIAQPKVVSTLYWDDGGVAQQTIPVTWNGKPYIIFTDETGTATVSPPAAGRADSCAKGKNVFGFARIIDISDEKNPKLAAKLMLEVNDASLCQQYIVDFPAETADLDNYGYSAHYCTPDTRSDPKILACGYWGAGLRVFDVRNPYLPKEIAYYKPPAQRTKFLPGSSMWFDYGKGKDRTTDRVSANVRFRTIGNDNYLWFAGQDNGFMIVKFTKPLSQLLP
jgi:hypothetical protein